MKTLASLPLLAAAATLNVVAHAQAASPSAETFPLDGIARIEFQIDKANVAILASDRSDLELTLVPARGFDPTHATQTVRRDGDSLLIEIDYHAQKSGWFGSKEKKGYQQATLSLPPSIEVDIRTRGGNIEADGLRAPASLATAGGNVSASDIVAPLQLRTSGGNIRLSQIEGPVDARTSGGNIVADALVGRAELRTSGGNIRVSGEIPSLQAHTSGGNIQAELFAPVLEPLELKTSGGNVRATLHQGLQAPAHLVTSGGAVSIELPPEQGFELIASSSGDRVSFEHPGPLQGSIKPKRIEGAVNGGGPLVRLKTAGGRARVASL